MSEIIEIIVPINTLTEYCGFFSSKSNVNNGYNYLHPKQEEKNEDYETREQVGSCFCHSCPIAYQIYKEDENDDSTPYEEEDEMMNVTDEIIIKEIQLASQEYEKKIKCTNEESEACLECEFNGLCQGYPPKSDLSNKVEVKSIDAVEEIRKARDNDCLKGTCFDPEGGEEEDKT